MIKYYWKQAWELLKQHKLFSVLYITGAGLAIAMTMVVFVAHYIRGWHLFIRRQTVLRRGF